MSTRLLMGNQAMAIGAIVAGVEVVTGYPGTPSTEVLETIAKENVEDLYVEWSINEKAALEVAAGASMAGKRSLVTMKQVGLNASSDPLMCLAYVGVSGGMVILVADDPGPISSQTEQDTRHFAQYSKLPIFDPTSVEEAYEMMVDCFELSEKYETPVIIRPTTRICHAYASIEVSDNRVVHKSEGFKKDSRWVIFPKLSYNAHLNIEKRNPIIADEFSEYRLNTLEGRGKLGIVSGGVSFSYTKEALNLLNASEDDYTLFKVATPHPFPEKLALEFLNSVEDVIVVEELDPVIERQLTYICGKHHISHDIKGKLTGHVQQAGENTVESVSKLLSKYLDIDYPEPETYNDKPDLPVRPPVLCAGCPHRASFYAVKQAMRGKKAVFTGDIGCYTLGNAQPLDMVDTCLCMGAGVTNTQGIHIAEPDTTNFAFIGDSTFFHSGITGIINAVYNQTNMVLVVLDNSTTAMTGHQPHPGTGKTMMGDISSKISIPGILKAIGLDHVAVVDPLDLDAAKEATKHAAEVAKDGVSAIVFESPCIFVTTPGTLQTVYEEECTSCGKCIRDIGCPSITKASDGKAVIDPTSCYGCELCTQICPFDAIGGYKND